MQQNKTLFICKNFYTTLICDKICIQYMYIALNTSSCGTLPGKLTYRMSSFIKTLI